MPNGHGGIPRYGSPILLLVFLLVLLRLEISRDFDWTIFPAYGLAASIAWRFSWHLFLYPLMEYGGSYTSVEALEAATRRYRLLAIVLIPGAVAAVFFFWP
ncbi:MAG: hypothetical protein OEZ54_06025 [Gemmatimonadota bacterium]|nr:hypothetical protein [Gemmatimonadota bacterium]